MAELVRLQIYVEIDDTWAWVAMGTKRQPDDVVGAPRVAQDAPAIDEGVQADPALGCREFMWTCEEIDDRSSKILYMDDFMYGTADGC
ncbi:hypothetical protein Tco_0420183, partial [Tanacetum coccineum]